MPNVNLISNIGFGVEATHTQGTSRLTEMAVQPMTFPLRHPPTVLSDRDLELASERTFSPGTLARAASRLRREVVIRLRQAGLGASRT